MPNIDPRMLKSMMDKLGIKSKDISAKRVVIECENSDIVVTTPTVTAIDAQGVTTYQIGGVSVTVDKVQIEINDEDVKFVTENTGVTDEVIIRKVLAEVKGDIAKAILLLKEKS